MSANAAHAGQDEAGESSTTTATPSGVASTSHVSTSSATHACTSLAADPVPPPPAFARLFGRRGRKKLHHYDDAAGTVMDLRPCALTSSGGGEGAGGVTLLASSTRVRGRQYDPPTKILDFLYLGCVQDAQDAAFLSEHNIQYIINVSEEEYWSVDRRIIVFPFKASDRDGFDIARFFCPTRHIIDRVCKLYFVALRRASGHDAGGDAGGATSASGAPRVLVHCQRGRSRSATIVLAYLIYRNGWSVAEALRYVRSRRPSVEPNLGFLAALRTLQESMSVKERNEKCSQHSVVVKNVSCTTPASVVQAFFETHVGMVRDVLMHRAGGDVGEDAKDCAVRRDGSAEHACVRADTDDETRPGAVPPATTLCIVSFACAENAHRAKIFAALHPAEMQLLCPAEGKAVKVLLPAKIIASSAPAAAATTAAAKATVAHHTATGTSRGGCMVGHSVLAHLGNGAPALRRHAHSADQHRRRAESVRLRPAALQESDLHDGVTHRAVTACSIPGA